MGVKPKRAEILQPGSGGYFMVYKHLIEEAQKREPGPPQWYPVTGLKATACAGI